MHKYIVVQRYVVRNRPPLGSWIMACMTAGGAQGGRANYCRTNGNRYDIAIRTTTVLGF